MDSFVLVHNGQNPKIFYELQMFFQSVGIFLYDCRFSLPPCNDVSVPVVVLDPNKTLSCPVIPLEDTNYSDSISFLLHQFSLSPLIPYYELYQKYQMFSFYYSALYEKKILKEETAMFQKELFQLSSSSNPYLIYAYAYFEFLSHPQEESLTASFLTSYLNGNLKLSLFPMFTLHPTLANQEYLKYHCNDSIYRYLSIFYCARFQKDPLVEYKKCIEENPSFLPAYLEYAKICEMKNKWKDATKVYEKILKLFSYSKEELFPHEFRWMTFVYSHLILLYEKEENEVERYKYSKMLQEFLSTCSQSIPVLEDALVLEQKKIS